MVTGRCWPMRWAQSEAWSSQVVFDKRISKLFGKTGLFQNTIGGMARPDFVIDGKTHARDRAVPDLMIAFSLSFETAIFLTKQFLQQRRVNRLF
uniref:Uncharacterized protein n=1 Tax=Candidatus Kentrum sp. LPFa TaxID=2126335 RepID=A0A450WC78_9GAMM|nr:MAG: hypothetical protein BECKLPF1236B_GA0070989_10659 [Candidatus Kentron sp. LPFa]